MEETALAETPIAKIYGKKQSRAIRCLWALEEMGLPYEHIPIDHNAGENRTAEYLALNPSGKVPTLVEGDFVLSESMAINLYLAAKPPAVLMPPDAKQLAATLQWTSWALSEVEAFTVNIFREYRRGEGKADQQRIAEWLEVLQASLRVIETQLAKGSPYLLGDRFTIADLNTASSVSYVKFVGFEMDGFPLTEAWLERCFSRPAWQKLED